MDVITYALCKKLTESAITGIYYADGALPAQGDSKLLYVYRSGFYRWDDNEQSYSQLASGDPIDWITL